jgi:hypothetical protein
MTLGIYNTFYHPRMRYERNGVYDGLRIGGGNHAPQLNLLPTLGTEPGSFQGETCPEAPYSCQFAVTAEI